MTPCKRPHMRLASVQGVRSVHAHPLKASAVEPELFAPEELLEPKQDRSSAFEQASHAESDTGASSMNGPSSSAHAGHKWFANWFGKDHDAGHDGSIESPLRQPPFVSRLSASCTTLPGHSGNLIGS